jgi:hypothetical protein
LATLLVVLGTAFAQEAGQNLSEPAEKTGKEKVAAPEKTASKPELPFQIQLLETHVRFEVNGDSRKEVHTIVKINNVLGAHQFARLTFDYNRAFQQVEIPLVRISHAKGGTSELLPSAVTDAPNPAVEKFPAYQDVRVKSVRILGLEEGDMVEYRVITTTTKHPLAPDFWLEHTFDRSGQVLQEDYELDLPGHRNSTTNMMSVWNGPRPLVYLGIPSTGYHNYGDGKSERSVFQWKIASSRKLPPPAVEEGEAVPDVIVSSFTFWLELAERIASQFPKWTDEDREDSRRRLRDFRQPNAPPEKSLERIYDFVSKSVTTVDLPLGANGFRIRPAKEILETGYATPVEKCFLFAGMAQSDGYTAEVLLSGAPDTKDQFPRPSSFDHVLVGLTEKKKYIAVDPSLEVAPLGVVAAPLRGKTVLTLTPRNHGDYFDAWVELPENLPFRAFQKVGVDASLEADGKLTAKVKYTVRGDNELLLRVAFHQTAKEKWKDVAGLLALSDGFRGQVTSVDVSDPTATKDPFTVEYEIMQAKFVDWSKKPVRIPALLPQIGLPDPPARQAAGEAARRIELGTPLDVETQMTLKLPAGTVVQTPAGTSVERDYARFTSKYSAAANTVTASRRVNFLMREIPRDRAMDYTSFVHAVQSDQAQMITLMGAAAASDEAKPAKAPPIQ